MTDDKLIAFFSSYIINERHYSELTHKAYMADVRDFRKFLEETGGGSLHEVELSDARIYLSYLTDQDYDRNSISRKISSLRSFYQFLLKNSELDFNPFAHLNMKKRGLNLPNFFYEEELKQLFDVVTGEEPLDYRNSALLEILYGTGIRVSECVQITLQDLDFDLSLLFVKGKGQKERYVPFGQYAHDAILEYMENGRAPLMAHHQKEHNHLLVNHHGDPITAGGVQYILKQLVKQTSLTSDIHPHKIRHTFATHLLDNGADIRTVQELLGHESLSSTQIYAHVTKEHLQSDYKKYFPRS